MDATTFLNAGDPVPYYDVSASDFQHDVDLTAIYQLPIGRGKKLLGGSSGILDAIVGGWQIEGVLPVSNGLSPDLRRRPPPTRLHF